MFEVTRYDAERRVLPATAVAVGIATYVGLILSVAPSVLTEVSTQEIAEGFSPQVIEIFGLDVIGTIEGYLAAQFYIFGWVVLVGSYIVYSAAGSIAGSIEDDRLDLLLATQISRRQVLFEKYLALLVPITVVNVVVGGAVYLGSILIGDPVPLGGLLAVHLFSIPYFLCCGAIGFLCSVLTRNRTIAEVAGVGFLLVAYVVDAVTAYTGVTWLGVITPPRHYEPIDILARGTYDYVGAGILVVAALVLLLVSQLWFTRVDIQ